MQSKEPEGTTAEAFCKTAVHSTHCSDAAGFIKFHSLPWWRSLVPTGRVAMSYGAAGTEQWDQGSCLHGSREKTVLIVISLSIEKSIFIQSQTG